MRSSSGRVGLSTLRTWLRNFSVVADVVSVVHCFPAEIRHRWLITWPDLSVEPALFYFGHLPGQDMLGVFDSGLPVEGAAQRLFLFFDRAFCSNPARI